MDYKKKYDEALKCAEMYYKENKDYNAGFLPIIFPELAESEDERIRKHLIKHFSNKSKEEWNEMPIKDILAWLEKQKEASKAIEAVDRIDKYIDENVANAHDMKDSNPDKQYYRGWDDALGEMARILQDVYSGEKQKEHKKENLRDFIDNFPYSDKQKEQKPWKVGANAYFTPEQKSAEWSEDDEKMLKSITSDLFCGTDFNIELKSMASKKVNWLKDKLKSLHFPPKQGWSEEDEKRLELVIDCVYEYYPDPVMKYKLKDWLKSLPWNLKKKNEDVAKLCSNEWSEEDRLHYANVLEALEYVKGCKSDYDKIEAVKSDIAWFKSLRPSWKPSTEQMKALTNFIVGDEYDAHALAHLWAELKELSSKD